MKLSKPMPQPPTIREELQYIVTKHRLGPYNDEQLVERLMYVISHAQVEAIKAVKDVFENPPAEVGAAEDLHFHTHQILRMLDECITHIDELAV